MWRLLPCARHRRGKGRKETNNKARERQGKGSMKERLKGPLGREEEEEKEEAPKKL